MSDAIGTIGSRLVINSSKPQEDGNMRAQIAQAQQEGLAETERAVTKLAETEQNETGQSFDREALATLVKGLNDVMKQNRHGLAFSVHDDSGKTVIDVKDIESDEVVRKIPSEEVLALAEYFAQHSEDSKATLASIGLDAYA